MRRIISIDLRQSNASRAASLRSRQQDTHPFHRIKIKNKITAHHLALSAATWPFCLIARTELLFIQ